MIELLSPAGSFECVKAAVQNGADAIYLGSTYFSARAFAENFSETQLEESIKYCRIRNVKVFLTLNTLITDNEFEEAFELAKTAYIYGVNAIIVQDLGLAQILIKHFPDLPIHASTQMSIHTLDGVLALEKQGFKRVVLSRELPLAEISYICKNSKAEIECFAHGALCISYSGQCLFSSLTGARSANRGKCAQPCRLPYSLLENDKKIDSGYLMSPKDFCAIEYIPEYISAGVKCLKIEGRMKSPEYVATVTRIYRKYIDLANSNQEYIVDEKDKKDLMQVFNRGNFSSGHLKNEPNRDLICKDKSNNMGLLLGKVEQYNKNKGHITLKLNEPIEIGDTVSLENEEGSYTISEIMNLRNSNITKTTINNNVIIGRMKGNIKIGDNIYKLSSKTLFENARQSYNSENIKIGLKCIVKIKKDLPISIEVQAANKIPLYKDLNIKCELDAIPVPSINRPLDEDSVKRQISKTTSSCFEFKNIVVDLDENLFLPKVSLLNELRRNALELTTIYISSLITRNIDKKIATFTHLQTNNSSAENISDKKISLLLNNLNTNYDYSKIIGADKVYIPLKAFFDIKLKETLKQISENFNIYIYIPTIIKENYRNLCSSKAVSSIETYNIKGIVFSNIANLQILADNLKDVALPNDFKIVANFTFNVFNTYTINTLKSYGINIFTLSPELDFSTISHLCDNTILEKEMIVYGNIPIMNMNYCFLGDTNKCYPTCGARCTSCNNYYLKDRLNMNFRIIPDNLQTITTLYNSKLTSISTKNFNINYARIDILDENIDEINNIIETVKSGNRLEGKDYTNGNLNRQI